MGVTARTSASQRLPIGGLWDIAVSITDSAGSVSATAPTVTVTLPDGSTATPTAEADSVGHFRAAVTTTLPGRYAARVVAAGYGAADFTAWASAVVPGTGMPSLADLRGASEDRDDPDDLGYLGANSWTDDEIQDALDAEAAAQRSLCEVPADYPGDMRQALLRRTARNLAMRKMPLAVLRGDADGGDTILPGRDPEVRRLESPYRRMVVG